MPGEKQMTGIDLLIIGYLALGVAGIMAGTIGVVFLIIVGYEPQKPNAARSKAK